MVIVVMLVVVLVGHCTGGAGGGANWKQLNLRIAFTVTDVIFIFIFIAK